MKSRVEINFVRLVESCVSLVGNEESTSSWRFKKYVETLENFLLEMKKVPNAPAKELYEEYTRKVKFLKGLVISEEMPTTEEKSVAVDLISHGEATIGDDQAMKTLHQSLKAAYERQMKNELLNPGEKRPVSKSHDDRQKLLGNSRTDVTDSSNVDELLKHQRLRQEETISDMISLTKDLKNQAMFANQIVKKDVDVLSSSNKLADANAAKLTVETSRLNDHLKNICRFGSWLLLIFAFMIFLGMVFFIKIFKKRVYHSDEL